MTDKNNKKEPERRDRALTDNDVKKIVDCLEDRLEERFYINLGKGIWAFVWRAAIGALLALAAWGHYKGS